MAKILFVGDVHLTPRQPISRKDDYQNTLLMKLNALKNIQEKHNISDVVFLGDIFNTNHLTLAFFTKVFAIFKQMASISTLHTVIGNHDILYNTESTIQESPIQLLRDAGVISTNKKIPFLDPKGNTTIHLFDYIEETPSLPPVGEKSGFDIFVGHYFYAVGFDDVKHTITKEQCKTLGYNAYVLGHDHTFYSPIINDTYQVHRTGSITRSTSDNSQISREVIQVSIYDTDRIGHFDYVCLDGVMPIKDVFVESKLIDKITVSEITDDMQVFLDALDFGSDDDIFEVLHNMPMSQEIKDTIEFYLNKHGAYKDGGDDK